jgi:predicted secreted protein
MTQRATRVAELQVPAEERRPELGTTTGAEEPLAVEAEEEAPTEARLVDIASILGAPTVTVVRSACK